MNNIAYIAYYDADYHACSSNIMGLDSASNLPRLINIFNDSTVKDIYQNYYISKKHIIFTTDTNLKTIFSNYVSQYNWFVFLSNNSLYNSNFTVEIEELCNKSECSEFIAQSQPSSSSSNIRVLSKEKIKEYIRFNLDIKDILKQNTLDIKTNIVFSASTITGAKNLYNTFHNDNYCIFANFTHPIGSQIKNSFVYINKKNHRVYNIVNNIVGYITDSDPDYGGLTIEWKLDENNIIAMKYRLDNYSKVYIST